MNARENPQDLTLDNLFHRLTAAYPDLYRPPETALMLLDSELERGRRVELTIKHIIATSGAVALFASFPLLLVGGIRIGESIQPTVEHLLNHRGYLDAHPEMAFAAGLAAFSGSFYTLIMHHLTRIPRLQMHFDYERTLGGINRTSWHFLLYAGVVNYAALGVGLMFLCSYSAPGGRWARWGVMAWLCVPLPLISFLPFYLLLFALVLIFRRNQLHDEAPQAALLRDLLLLLDYLKDIAAPHELSTERRRNIMRRIGHIAGMLRGLYSTNQFRNASAAWASRRIGEVADHFLALSSWVAFPKEDTLLELKRRVLTYVNIIAAGSYDALPTEQDRELSGLIKDYRRTASWRRVGGLLGLFLLASFPLAAYAGVATYFRAEIPNALNPVAAVVYSGWVGFCLLSYLDRLAPDAKATVIDVVKTVFRR